MLKILKSLNKKEIIFILFAVILIFGQVWLDLKMPDYMAKITKLVQSSDNVLNEILKNGAIMLLCSFGSLILAFMVGYISAYTGSSFEKNLRKKVYEKVESFGMEEIKSFRVSSLITRNTNDINQIKMFVVIGIQMLAKAPIMAVMAIIKIAGKEPSFLMITICGVLAALFVSLIVILIVIPKFKKIQKLTDNLNDIARENLTGIRVVRAYNAEKYQLNKFSKANEELTNTHLFTGKVMSFISPTFTTIMSFLTLFIYWVGAGLINAASLMDKINIFSDMIVFSSYSVQVIISFIMLTVLFIIYPRASVSANRINEVLETKPKIEYGNVKKDTTSLKGVVEFKNVSFKYPDAEEYILKDISFKSEKGQTIAIIGSTGSGKSTLINLIPRFYDVSDGELLIDGQNVKDLDENYLNSKIGYISQKAILFKDSIKNNISLGKVNNKKVVGSKIDEALKLASASEFVSKMPKKGLTEVSQSGTNLSGGQKQRLSIARAIARDPEIYIFDDSFSALDYKTDYAIRKSLKKVTNNSTIFIVAQRIGTIKNADLIIVLDEGKMVGKGTHKELLKSCDVYREIAESQLSKEEIENAWA